ncbi:MAG: hypothetical protein PVI03_05525 [Candidatus Thorarchaeota archaeon]|jgi:hypothetical protein
MNEDNSNPLTNPLAYLESDPRYATLPKDKFEEETSRVNIHVRSYRRLNADPEGVSAKAAIDGIVERGILADDSSKQVKAVTFENITGCSKDEEQTFIIITEGD